MKNVIGIQGVPRSGTSWLAQIFNSSPAVALRFQPLFSYAFKDKLDLNSTEEEIANFFSDITNTEDAFVNMRDPDIHKGYPKFEKNAQPSHLVFKHVRYNHLLHHLMKTNSDLKLILIVRNPKAVLASWYKAPREFNPAWNLKEQWQHAKLKNQGRPEEFFGYDKWKEATRIFLELKQLFPARIALIRYKDLLLDPLQMAVDLFEFAELPLEEQTIEFIAESTSTTIKGVNSVYRVKAPEDNNWMQVLPTEMIEAIDKDSQLQTALKSFYE
ncbi:sulfotransferase domain-containing protein [Gilvibacter sediminis]|uniref:sulfotransferase domain-containing protein n=1 Tax=Gilvibacter sediminis TaxID=379071 RepID=UPI0023507B39|nr:sulfotransferase domain-containing protein [Gilvibacter sediminis]MDC7999269.1 sulfotransferase domain-containing protein [Gilvibacter sediminis]